MAPSQRPRDEGDLIEGQAVQVRCRFDGNWTSGFVICDVRRDGSGVHVRIRRVSDGAELPLLFDRDDVRSDA
jgi:hypothetical protein